MICLKGTFQGKTRHDKIKRIMDYKKASNSLAFLIVDDKFRIEEPVVKTNERHTG